MDAEGFVALQDPSDELADILLCAANSSFVKPIFWPAYPGRGIVLQLSVADAHAEYRRLRASAAPFALDLIDEPFNGRPFTLRDPAGMLVDVAQGASF